MRRELSGLFVLICYTALRGAKQRSQMLRISSSAGLDGREQKKSLLVLVTSITLASLKRTKLHSEYYNILKLGSNLSVL